MDGGFLAPIGVLLLVACLIAMLIAAAGAAVHRRAGRRRLPDRAAAQQPELPLSRELIFNVFLPPLVFEAALQLDWRRFRDELPLTLTLAFAGVAIAATIVAVRHALDRRLELDRRGLFGVLIAATDPVSVIASFREMGCQPRVSMVVESESLLNDGVAAVGFAVLSAIAAGASPSRGQCVPAFLWTLGGG